MESLINTQSIINILILCTTYICVFYLFTILRKSSINTTRKTPVFCIGVFLAVVIAILGGNLNLFLKLLFILLIFVSSIIVSKNPLENTVYCILSISISFCIEYISVLISGSLFFIVGFTQFDLLSQLLACLIQLCVTHLLTKTRFIKKLFKYFDTRYYEVGLLLSFYVLLFSVLLTQPDIINSRIGAILFVGIPIALSGILLWLRSFVHRYNKSKLKTREDEFTQQEITEKDARIERLEGEVATLAKQLHRDNHLLSSLERTVQTIAETDSADERKQLANEFHALYSERNNMIAKEQQESKILPSTGIALIDGSLSEMYVKATAHGIAFDLIVGEELYYLVNNIISQTELQTLLCDHIKDAVIAVTATENTNGKILVTIEKNDGLFEISIRDNGIDFAPDTLAKLGRERITTHADEGGSGIGFMTTFETLAKTKSSLIITEYETETPFTKAVSFVFDGLHRFVISSYRKDKLKEIVTRDDVILL